MGHWAISSALEPIYVDDKEDNPNYDSRLDPENIECMMCPCSLEECDRRETCYWDEMWHKDEEDGDDGRSDYWRDSAEQAGWFDKNGDWHPYEEV